MVNRLACTNIWNGYRKRLDLFILLVVFSHQIPISQVGANSSAAAIKASLMPLL